MAIPFYKASTFTGLVSTKNYGTSEEWNRAFTTVKSNSAAWGLDTRSLWGSISGTLSAQTDLWSYLSAVGTSNFDIVTLNNYLSTTPILLSSINVFGPILSAGVNLLDIFLTKNTTFNNYIYTTVSQNVSSNRKYGFDTTLGSLTATLPSNPQLGDEIEFFDIGGKWLLNPLTINNNTKFIEQLNDKLLCNVKFGIFKLIYAGLITGWRIVPLPKHDVPSFVAPVVSISSTLDIGYDPIAIAIGFIGINNLSPTIGPVDNWYWNLTGGSQPGYFTQAVTYTYSTPGVYTVTLTGSNVVGIGTATKTITASPFLVPTPVISAASLSGITPFSITLSGINTLPVSASPVTNWYWNLTGGNTAQFTTQNVTYTYTTSGSYTVNLTASNASGFGTTTRTITTTLPLNGLLAFWPLNEASGTRYDISGNGRHLADRNNNITGVPGLLYNAAQFTGVTTKTLSSANNFPIGNTQPFTLSMWLNYTAFNSPGTRIITVNPAADGAQEWGIVQDGTNLGVFNNYGSGRVAMQITGSARLSAGQWEHLVITKDSSYTWKYYKNGTLLQTTANNSTNWIAQNTAAVFLGQNIYGYETDGPPNGLVDAVGIWNRVLTDQEISTLYNSGNGLEI